jgi:hypothetical protein
MAWTLASLVVAFIAAACSSPSGQVCEEESDCAQGYECVSTGGVAFGDKICLLAERAPTGADAELDAATDTPTDTGDAAPHAPEDAGPDTSDTDPAHTDTSDTDPADSCAVPGCDVDSDGDGVVDSEDGCPLRPNPHQRDRDGDGIQDACDPELSVDYADAIFAGPRQGCCGGIFPWQVTGGDVTGDGRDDLIITGHGDNEFSLWVIDGTSQPSGTVDLSTAVARFSVAQEGGMGLRVGRLGDVNGDGIDDLLVGHPGDNNNGGRAFLFLGGSSLQGDLTLRQPDGVYFDTEGRVGFSVDIAPDLNGDGLDDMVVGEAYGGVGALQGRVHIIFGRTTPIDRLRLLPTEGADMRFLGKDGDQIGWSVAGVGDVDGDGLGDLVIGAPKAAADAGAAYLVFGDSTWADTTMQLEDVALELTPQDTRSPGMLGASVGRAGDVDGDGRTDFLVGEPVARGANGSDRAGAAYLVFGRDTWASTDGSSPIAALGVRLEGVGENGRAGSSFGMAGDMDADGFADFLIGAPNLDAPSGTASRVGAAYLVYGSAQLASLEGQATSIDANARTFVGRNTDSFLGATVSAPGDIDGDGQLELFLSSAGGDTALDATGAAFLFYGL